MATARGRLRGVVLVSSGDAAQNQPAVYPHPIGGSVFAPPGTPGHPTQPDGPGSSLGSDVQKRGVGRPNGRPTPTENYFYD